MVKERTAISEKDIREAREQIRNVMDAIAERMRSLPDNKKESKANGRTRKLVRNDDYMEIKLKDGKKFKAENIIKAKTVFHSVEESIEDQYGGILKVHYGVRKTIEGLHKWILDNYPKYSIKEIQEYADEQNISYDEAKKYVSLRIAESEFWIRIKMARFLHEQLKPTLEIVLKDLINDAASFGMSHYGYTLAHARDFDEMGKEYLKLRKKRSNFVRERGKRGRSFVSEEEVNNFIEAVLGALKELEESGKKISANAVARKVIGSNHTNPLKAFKDKLGRFDLSLENLRDAYMQSKINN